MKIAALAGPRTARRQSRLHDVCECDGRSALADSIPNTLICEFVAEEETNLRESLTRQKLRAKDAI